MDIVRKLNGMSLSIPLTDAEMERAYRVKEHMYRREDAERHLDDFAQSHGISVMTMFDTTGLMDGFCDVVTEKFLDKQDCNVAENAVWESIIESCLSDDRKDEWCSRLARDVSKDDFQGVLQQVADWTEENQAAVYEYRINWLKGLPFWCILELMKTQVWKIGDMPGKED